MRPLAVALSFLALTSWPCPTTPAAQTVQEARLWILPFDVTGTDRPADESSRAVSELLLASISNSSSLALVERARLELVLAEQALSCRSLDDPSQRQQIGGLLGATVMVHGSIAHYGSKLLATAHATELASSCVLAAFLRGLGLYYAGRHHQALASFLEAEREPENLDVSRLWKAHCYIGLDAHEHAWLELARIQVYEASTVGRDEVARLLALCAEQMDPADVALYRQLIRP